MAKRPDLVASSVKLCDVPLNEYEDILNRLSVFGISAVSDCIRRLVR
jgi:hypothetical protein